MLHTEVKSLLPPPAQALSFGRMLLLMPILLCVHSRLLHTHCTCLQSHCQLAKDLFLHLLGQDLLLTILALGLGIECTRVGPKKWNYGLWWLPFKWTCASPARETSMWLLNKSCPRGTKWNLIPTSRPRQGSFWGNAYSWWALQL